MKITLVNTFDRKGGAAIAALRFHKAFLRNNINSSMLVLKKDTGYPKIIGPSSSFEKIHSLVTGFFSVYLSNMFVGKNRF